MLEIKHTFDYENSFSSKEELSEHLKKIRKSKENQIIEEDSEDYIYSINSIDTKRKDL